MKSRNINSRFGTETRALRYKYSEMGGSGAYESVSLLPVANMPPVLRYCFNPALFVDCSYQSGCLDGLLRHIHAAKRFRCWQRPSPINLFFAPLLTDIPWPENPSRSFFLL